MRLTKKIITSVLICSMAISALSGCEGSTSSASDTDSTSATSSVQGGDNTTSQTTASQSTTSQAESVDAAPVPDEEEDKVVQEALPPSVYFSHESGIYPENFSLELAPVEDGEIYYTLDGSDPAVSDTAQLYSGALEITDRKGDKNVVSAVDPLLIAGTFNEVNKSRDGFVCKIDPPADEDVDKCTVIRAAVKKSDGSFCGETHATYFIGTAEDHIEGLKASCEASGMSLAVMSISVNYDDFFDSEKGIYVKGDIFDEALETFLQEERLRDPETARSLDANYKQKGREWEREAAISLFEFNENGAEEVLNQGCGIRIQGNYSRSDLQKGLRLYARKEYGKKNFKYAVFGEDYVNYEGKTMNKFDTLTLRNGGNCAFTAKFNDTYWQSLVTEMNCSTQRSRPCVVYLNGEYWGLYILQEDYTNDYAEDYYGVNKDDVVIYKGDAESLALGYKLDEGDLPDGVTDETYYFHDILNFFETHSDLKSEEDYNEFIKLVDPASVMDYFAVQCWIDNKWDWPGKNWSMWKTTTASDLSPYADGRWRLMFYDIEFGGVCGEGDARNNTLRNANYKDNGLLDMDTENPAVLCFAYLMTNEGFRTEFCDKLTGLSSDCFEKNRALERLDYFEDVYGPLYEQFFARYEGTGSADDALNGGYATARCIRDFINSRQKNIKQMVTFCERVLG